MTMMRPEEIVLALLRCWWIVAIAAVAAGSVAYVGTASQAKTYTVSARVMAIAEPPDYWLDLYAKNRLASYKDLISNWAFVSASLEEANTGIDPGVATSKLELGHNPDANTVQIVVNDTDPVRAAAIVNALADGFVRRNAAENERLFEEPRGVDASPPGRVDMLKLETPTAPTTASGPRVRINTLAGAALGAVAGLMLAFFLLYLDDTLKKTADLDRYLELPVLASVPDEGGRTSAAAMAGGQTR